MPIIAIIIIKDQNCVKVLDSEPPVHNGTPSPNHGTSHNLGKRNIGSTGETQSEPITVKFKSNNRVNWVGILIYLIRFFGLNILPDFDEGFFESALEFKDLVTLPDPCLIPSSFCVFWPVCSPVTRFSPVGEPELVGS
jgi:hypothetical protein